MMRLLTQILAAGGLLLAMAGILVLRVLLVPLAGLTAVICVALVSYQTVAVKDYRKNLFVRESDKRKLLDGTGS
jgi:hypothetical protein